MDGPLLDDETPREKPNSAARFSLGAFVCGVLLLLLSFTGFLGISKITITASFLFFLAGLITALLSFRRSEERRLSWSVGVANLVFFLLMLRVVFSLFHWI